MFAFLQGDLAENVFWAAVMVVAVLVGYSLGRRETQQLCPNQTTQRPFSWLWNTKSTAMDVAEKGKMMKSTIPRHIAVIMDGNRRYGRSRFGAGSEIRGHRAGGEILHDFMDWCIKYGVEVLTVYAFSTENWKRPKREVDALMNTFVEHCPRIKRHCLERGCRAKVVSSDFHLLSPRIQTIFRELEASTSKCKNLTLNICVSYGGRSEIVGAVKHLCKSVEKGSIAADTISEADLSRHLLTTGCPDPELVVRTSGEYRLSNFLLWQVAYSEMIFVHKHWPELTEDDFLRIMDQYTKRKRRFGK